MKKSILEKLSIRTPLIPFFSYPQSLKSTIYLKAENLQPFGSFKVRGIDSLFKSMPDDLLSKGIVAASAGNMGQSLAFVAKKLEIPCKIIVPDTTPDIKKNKIRQLGAILQELPMTDVWKLITHPPEYIDGMTFIHPFFTDALLTGYEAIVKEILVDLPTVDAVVVPIGIGGLAMAIARAFRQLKPDTVIYVCEPETAASFNASLAQKKPAKIEFQSSFVDAIGTPETLAAVYEHLAPLIRGCEVIKLEHAREALVQLFTKHKLVCEGAAASALAAAIQISERSCHKNIVCILTGGNLSTDYIQLKLEKS